MIIHIPGLSEVGVTGNQTKHNHAEAFMLMQYRCKNNHTVMIWNSRDGVTPFMIKCQVEQCGEYAEHVNWGADFYHPKYQPRIGSYIFVDLTEERALLMAQRNIALAKASGHEYSMGPEELAKSFMNEGRGGSPDLRKIIDFKYADELL